MITMILVVYGTCRRSLAKLSLFYNNNKTYYVYTTAFCASRFTSSFVVATVANFCGLIVVLYCIPRHSNIGTVR
jgi:hypothetical protein